MNALEVQIYALRSFLREAKVLELGLLGYTY